MFCAFDLETTGLDPYRDQILQIGAVLFTKDRIVSEFSALVRHERYEGDAFALQMNAAILKRLAGGEGQTLSHATGGLSSWMMEHGYGRENRPHPVGFNVGPFDVAFLKAATGGIKLFHHRAIELGSVFTQPDGTPGTSTKVIKELLGGEVAHDALQDAHDAAELYMGRLQGKW